MSTLAALAAEGSTYETPGVKDFWQPLIGDGAFAVTRASIVILLSVAIIAWLLLAGTKKLTVVPSRKQAATEVTYGMIRNGLGRDVIGSHDFLRFMPLLFTLFTLILLNNLFSVVPVIQFPTMSRIAFPAVLAIVVFVVYHWIGIEKRGFVGYFKSLVPSGLPAGLIPPIFLLELITDMFTRPVTLALRLFGNMFAGHLLLVLFIGGGEYMLTHGSFGLKIAGGSSLILGFVMTVFEILVQFLQAYIFTLLAAIYIAGALADEH
ncbi:F0F1 ATP synthase subunit A [Angustibacter sp. Root456]|uniref:F0F1 ATP synthase subunit A n=1 Tax=Angustibacter sp. Root456 TaxID=1736539 RepID=UPI0007001EC9|nr:F0F1 ATP synthase subunit A [Angustibacter sp. Root456]KQX69686.1 ATP synthase subunit A [Angustibacter sp. Root456]